MGPFAVWFVLLALLAPLAFLADSPEEPATAPVASVETIAHRVETLRGLRFRQLPQPKRVTPQEAQREALESFDSDYPPARRQEDETLYGTLGLLPRDVDLKELSESVFGEQVAGYYDPRDGRLRIVESAATGGRVLGEMVLAHELNHALEDQAFELDTDVLARGGDAAFAYQAFVEGTASSLMSEYLGRYFTNEQALGGILGGAFAPTGDLPPFMMSMLLFPYLAGETFVTDIRRGGSWKLVDLGFRTRVPASTEQILHPEKYLRIEEPREVALPGADGTFGEFQTSELLALAGGTGHVKAAAGWGGDAYAVRDGEVVIRWVWDTERDRAEFEDKLRAYTREMDRGSVSTDGQAVTLTVPTGA
jgi:hypothetical protein